MGEDDDDFTEAWSRSSDPSTSREAADRIRPTKLEMEVYGELAGHWPRYMTSIEIAAVMGKDKWSISPRLAPLERRGMVESIKKPSLNSSGRIVNMLAWRVVRRTPQQLSLVLTR